MAQNQKDRGEHNRFFLWWLQLADKYVEIISSVQNDHRDLSDFKKHFFLNSTRAGLTKQCEISDEMKSVIDIVAKIGGLRLH